MLTSIQSDKWILYKHIKDFEKIKAIALDVKNNCNLGISTTEKIKMKERLRHFNLYKARNSSETCLDSMSHRINTLMFYMFGYKTTISRKNKFIFSPLGNLFIKHINDINKLKKIFFTMLFSMQFEHPGNGTSPIFKLYPFRLIFKLLLDERLEFKLYQNEVSYLIMFVNSVDETKYEKLIEDILKLRAITNSDMENLFKKNENLFVKSTYEWEYYTTGILQQAGIINVEKGDVICRLNHPKRPTSKSPVTSRTATKNSISLSPDLKDFTQKLLILYNFSEKPLDLNAKDRMRLDIIKEIYNFYPKLLLDEIEEDIETYNLLELPKLIEKYSLNPNNTTAYLFENIIAEGFEFFYNVNLNQIGGPGNTDIEGLYTDKNIKFAIESKSTSNKLSSLNAGRLAFHRDKIGAEYTIVITPKYVPSVKTDIKGSNIVILLANTFSEYLYNHIFHDIKNIDYDDFNKIIMSNLGKDISPLISNLTIEQFSTK